MKRWILGLWVALVLVPAFGQVTELAIKTWPTGWVGVVQHVTMASTLGVPNVRDACIAGWKRGTKDRFSPYYRQVAMIDRTRMTAANFVKAAAAIASGDLAQLEALRNVPVFVDPNSLTPAQWLERMSAPNVLYAFADPVAKRCLDKLQAPPLTWVVAEDSDGKRPAYCLNADGTRGDRCGDASTTFGDPGPLQIPMPCMPHMLRSKETTTSIYGIWLDALPIPDLEPPQPKRVTLCREFKA